MDLRTLQLEQAVWSQKNFPNAKKHECLLGIVEEVGELTHAHLKAEQGIRQNENHEFARRDAVGDIVIFLAGYCTAHNISLQLCVEDAWNVVKERSWTKE